VAPPFSMASLPQIFASSSRAVVTLGSVHGISKVVSWSYFSPPATRRYTFSNQSVSVHPSAPAIEKGATPNRWRVSAAASSSSQVVGGSTPASLNTDTLYHMVDLLAALNTRPYCVSPYVPRSFQTGAKLLSISMPITSVSGWSTPCSAKEYIRPGCGKKATSGGLPPWMRVPRTVAI